MVSDTKINLSPKEKCVRVRGLLEQKLALLEEWARSGPPEGVEIPMDGAKLKRWRGPDGTFGVWADDKIHRGTGKNKDLAMRFQMARDQIEKWLNRKGRLTRAEAEVDTLRKQNDLLRVQNAECHGRIRRLERRVQEQEDTLAALKKKP